MEFYVPIITFYFTYFFFFNDTATTEIYTLSLHDALPILSSNSRQFFLQRWRHRYSIAPGILRNVKRSEEHTSELQSRLHLVCRLLLEKKKKKKINNITHILRRRARSRWCII